MRICQTAVVLAELGDTPSKVALRCYEAGQTLHASFFGMVVYLHAEQPKPRESSSEISHATDCSLAAWKWGKR
jgi:hypothetical protein